MTPPVQNPLKAAVDWGAINEDSKIAIPSEITDCLSWFEPKKIMSISLDLSRPRLIVVRNMADVEDILKERRNILLEDGEDTETGMLRVAMTYHFFRQAKLVGGERRILLRAIVLDHLDTKPGGRLLCIGYADRIEAHNEASAREILSRHANNLVIGLNQ